EILGIGKRDTATVLNLFTEIEILTDQQDLTVLVDISKSPENSKKTYSKYFKLEVALLRWLLQGYNGSAVRLDLREANRAMEEVNTDSDVPMIRNLLRYWEWTRVLEKERISVGMWVYKIRFRSKKAEMDAVLDKVKERQAWAGRIVDAFVEMANSDKVIGKPKERLVEFSVVSLKRKLEFSDSLQRVATVPDYEKYLLYLQSIEAINLKDGLMIYYNRLNIKRKQLDNKKGYTKEDYAKLDHHYAKKVEQVHIIGEYAKRLLNNYQESIAFTDDYFRMEYQAFLKKYFPGRRRTEIRRSLTPPKYREIFGGLSTEQEAAVIDNRSDKILVAAGPGSGKTRVLVRKMASLLLLEDIKSEQFLMLAFSRPAANEFRQRLKVLVPGSVNHVDIFTYHSFAFNLLGKVGVLDQADEIIPLATEAIRADKVSLEKVAAKSVIVLDEFQDISDREWSFIQAICERAEKVRLIVAGDDDQSIYEFRGSSVQFMQELAKGTNAKVYPLTKNYRSKKNIVEFANQFLQRLPQENRMKKGQILISDQSENGLIILNKYQKGYLLEPMAQAVKRRNLPGSTAVLTATNEEALQVVTLLKQYGLPAMLITSQAGYALCNLVELKAFTQIILQEADQDLGQITQGRWNSARDEIRRRFSASQKLGLVDHIITSFEDEFQR
ncbi:MAG TPA: ATP-dependent helicase, partial [Bacteroidetes bacterium]|nr:ATP-dependent helicase [Bacteroidota bacterium]